MKIKNLFSIFAIATIVFFAGCSKDDNTDLNKAPTVTSSDPANNATEVVLNKIVTVKFSQAMDPSSLTATTFTIDKGTTPVIGTVSYAGTTASFQSTTVLALNTVYTGTITTGAKNVSGNALENNFVWKFTTGSSTALAPTIISTQPLNNAEEVVLNEMITATFSEAMKPSTINNSSFTLKDGETTVAGEVSYTGKVLTFMPTNNLAVATVYTATVSTEAQNLDGIALAGVLPRVKWLILLSQRLL